MTRTLEDVVFIAAFTARSQAYAQAMARAGIAPGLTVFYGAPRQAMPGQADALPPPLRSACGVELPDLSEPLAETARRAGWRSVAVADPDVNSPALAALLDPGRFRLAVFSAYGGQIVKRATLDRGVPFLHLHAGWLPGFRGSTTAYYEMLLERRISASAILLVPELDAGPILARRHYAVPPPEVDIDYAYEPAVRADLLLEVLRRYTERGKLPEGIAQRVEEGATYFVIHPVLKHLAILANRPPQNYSGSRMPRRK